MAELGILPNSGLTIPALPLDIRASYFDRTPIPAPIPSTAKLSAAQGKAALYGSIADTLAKLPETLMGAYQAGRKMAVGNATSSAYKAALAGNPVAGTSLSDFKATGEGGVTFSPGDHELDDLKLKALQQKLTPKPTYYDSLTVGAHPSAIPAPPSDDLPSDDSSIPSDTAPIGTGTSYGYSGDKYGGPNAKASTTGPVGNALDEQSLAVSPDIEKMLLAKGHKFGDMVTLRTAKGDTVTRRWDDRTATDQEAAKLGLAPLRGRFDFHAVGGKPSPYNGVPITGIVSPQQASTPTAVAQAPAPALAGFGIDEPAPVASSVISLNSPVTADNILTSAPAPALGNFPSSLADEGDVIPGVTGALANEPSLFPATPVPTVAKPVRVAKPAFTPGVVLDPISRRKIVTMMDGTQFQVDPANPNKTIPMKSDKPAHQGFDSPEELQQFAQAHGMIPGNPKQSPDGKWYSDNSTFTPKLDRQTASRLAEANATGANISVAGKTPDEVAAALAAWQSGAGMTDAQFNHVTKLKGEMASMPIYHAAQNVIDGYHNAQLAAKHESGISDKTLIEEGQRVLNPQNGVRVQTIQMFGGSSGLLERIQPDYILSHFKKGTILTPDQRKEYLGILKNAYDERVKDMDDVVSDHMGQAEAARIPKEFSQKYFANPYKRAQDRQGSASGGSAGGARDNPMRVTSQAELDAAPSGAWVVDPKGNLGRKP